jgi:hypothetical protein
MNSIIAIGFGVLVGGVSASLYYGQIIKTMISQILDIKTVNNLLKEHTVKQDAKKKSKAKENHGSAKKRKSSGGESAIKS